MKYTSILLEWTAEKSKKSFIDSSIIKKENDFFEILILLTSKAVTPFFEEEDSKYIEEGYINELEI